MNRRGMTLVEVIATLGVMIVVLALAGRLLNTVLKDSLGAARTAEKARHIGMMLDRLKNDLDSARSLPPSSGDLTAGQDLLLIALPHATVCYQLREDTIVRRRIGPAGKAHPNEEMTWHVPNGKVNWRVLEDEGQRYALEVHTWIERIESGRPTRKLENVRVFFPGAIPGTREAK